MVYQGTVRGGVVVLPAGVHLADGLEVTVQPMPPPSPSPSQQTVGQSPQIRNGVPIFPRISNGATIDLELVNRLRDEMP